MSSLDNLPDLPERIAGLGRLATNLWWSWHGESRDLFRSISPSLWHTTRHNPLEMLSRAKPDRLQELAQDDKFLNRLDAAVDALNTVETGTESWYTRQFPDAKGVVAYFCAEFGLHRSIPIYSGGLGVLAGDHCKAAADLGVPLVGVGLMYRRGYFDQRLRLDGWQEDSEERFEHSLAPITRVLIDGNPSLTSVQMSGRTVHVGAWRINVGRVPVLLLDTDLDQNDPADRELAARLYAGGNELRLRQEWILGVAGVRVLRRLGYEPAVWHANEGHAAFMFMERMRELIAEGVSAEEAAAAVRQRSVFTTHTPVPAGHDNFSRELIEKSTGPIWDDLRLSSEQFFNLGRHPGHTGDDFHMTAMGLRLSSRINGVSVTHGSISRKMWQGLWPDRSESDVPIGAVTNGVHLPTWMSARYRELLQFHFGADWEAQADDPAFWDGVLDLDDAHVWRVHLELKGLLLDFVHGTARQRWTKRWTDASHLVGAGTLMTTQPLTIGFARRFATYKRADLIFRDLDRAKRLLTDPARPVQLIFAGKAHPADDPGKEVLQRVYKYAQDPEFEGRVAFLEDYGMHMAQRMVQGVDVWLNLPRVPQEACGTSGMKAALNGVPHLATSDGWWVEGHTGENGWRIPVCTDEDPDAHDAAHLYELLEDRVVPMYYDRDDHSVPVKWVHCMKQAIREAGRHFTARRMVKDYAREYYAPAARSAEAPAQPAGT